MRQTKRNSWKILTLCVTGAILVATAVYVAVTETNRGAPTDSVSLRLKWVFYAGWAGELLAADRGFWEDEGLVVSLAPGGFELDPIKLVAAGSDTIGVAGADQILLAREKGIPLVAFAVQYQIHPVGFISMEDSHITHPAQFVGKRIGVKLGTDVDPVYRKLLRKFNISSENVQEIPVKFSLAPFLDGTIDVYPGYLTSDLLIPEEKGYTVNTIRAADFDVIGYGNVYFTREDYLETHPEVLASFLKGVRRGWQQAKVTNPDVIADIALKYNDTLDREHEKRVALSVISYIFLENVPFGSMDSEGWKSLFDSLRSQDLISENVDWNRAFSLEILKMIDDE